MTKRQYERYGKAHRNHRRSYFLESIALACLIVIIFLTLIFWMGMPHEVFGLPSTSNQPGNGVHQEGMVTNGHSQVKVQVERAKIFVSIAAFRDEECVKTVRSLFSRAIRPFNVFLGISEERYEHDSSCLGEPEMLAALGFSRVRKLGWRDVVPSAFQLETFSDGRRPTPLLHAKRENDTLVCLLNANEPHINFTPGKSVLDGCQVVTRVGDPNDARGPTYGRYLSSLFFNNQDYYMVIDSHSRFIPGWDEKSILHARLMPTRGVLSHYPNGYVSDNETEFEKKTVMSMCKVVILRNNIPKLGAVWIRRRDRPVLQGFVAAGYIFGDAQFFRDVPFDPYLPYLFDGEEILYTVRLWTHGWDSYTPGVPFILHKYGRHDAPKFWSILKDRKNLIRSFERRTATRRVLYLLRRHELNTSRLLVTNEEAHQMNPAIGKHAVHFGMGKNRSLDDFWRFVQLSDEFLTRKDSEGRWVGGERLCPNE